MHSCNQCPERDSDNPQSKQKYCQDHEESFIGLDSHLLPPPPHVEIHRQPNPYNDNQHHKCQEECPDRMSFWLLTATFHL